jgi:2'-5' RNA ligase
MPRLFTGLEIPDDIAFELSLMRGGLPGARWIEPEDYHITLRFIGDISEDLALEIDSKLDHLAALPFEVRLSGLGYFGNSKPHSLHVTVAPSEALSRLQATHERICRSLGLAAETRRFIPHITLARLRGTPPVALQHYIAAHNLLTTQPFDVYQFVLFSARPSRGGGPYAVEEAYSLRAAM